MYEKQTIRIKSIIDSFPNGQQRFKYSKIFRGEVFKIEKRNTQTLIINQLLLTVRGMEEGVSKILANLK